MDQTDPNPKIYSVFDSYIHIYIYIYIQNLHQISAQSDNVEWVKKSDVLGHFFFNLILEIEVKFKTKFFF